MADLVDQVVEPGLDAKTGPVYGTGSDRLVGSGRGTLFMLREHLRTSVMGGRCDRPDAAACDYRLTYRSSQMVRTGAAKTKQCCEHMISATTTRELSTALHDASPEFRALWRHYAVKQSINGLITVRHPTAGIIKLDVIELGVRARNPHSLWQRRFP